MAALVILLLIVFLIAGVVGAVVEGLLWLLVIAAILFVLTGLFGRSSLRKHR